MGSDEKLIAWYGCAANVEVYEFAFNFSRGCTRVSRFKFEKFEKSQGFSGVVDGPNKSKFEAVCGSVSD